MLVNLRNFVLKFSKFNCNLRIALLCRKYAAATQSNSLPNDFSSIPIERIRNFSIIAHVDHGKSTLADRLLELTGAISKSSGNQQVLDCLQVERERGITVKAQTVSIVHDYKNETYLLNLIDTPGHVDFSSEVSRSLAACDGVILLVDACHGVQAQTVANFHLAKSRNLAVVPVLNKIDVKHANAERVVQDLHALFNIDPLSVLKISAKLGKGILEVLTNVIENIPPPNVDRNSSFRALIFDSWFDKYRGALNLIYVHNGSLGIGEEIQSTSSGKCYAIKSISVLRPIETAVKNICPNLDNNSSSNEFDARSFPISSH